MKFKILRILHNFSSLLTKDKDRVMIQVAPFRFMFLGSKSCYWCNDSEIQNLQSHPLGSSSLPSCFLCANCQCLIVQFVHFIVYGGYLFHISHGFCIFLINFCIGFQGFNFIISSSTNINNCSFSVSTSAFFLVKSLRFSGF